MRTYNQRLSVFLGALVIASWFMLYLEIARFHHVQFTYLRDIFWPVAGPSRPGGFVRAVVACSVSLPLPLIVALVPERRAHRQRTWLTGRLAILFGIVLLVFGAVNQLVRRPPFAFDPTLRTGNGGFLVLGAVLLAAGLIIHGRRASPATTTSSPRHDG